MKPPYIESDPIAEDYSIGRSGARRNFPEHGASIASGLCMTSRNSGLNDALVC
jgi:hypothetical protein